MTITFAKPDHQAGFDAQTSPPTSAPPASASQPLRSIAEIIEGLSREIPARHLHKRTVAGKTIEYIPWHVAARYMNWVCPSWSYEITKVIQLDKHVAVVARVSVPTLEGVISREAVGIEALDTNSFGDPTSNASSMALRRACALFGLNLSSYEK